MKEMSYAELREAYEQEHRLRLQAEAEAVRAQTEAVRAQGEAVRAQAEAVRAQVETIRTQSRVETLQAQLDAERTARRMTVDEYRQLRIAVGDALASMVANRYDRTLSCRGTHHRMLNML